MQIGSRFTEYGLTGGFFWICQLLVFTYSGQAKVLLSNLSSVKLEPSWILQIGSPAITALAIIAVFVAGLLLDLSAVYFRRWEMSVFHRHLIRNRDWLDQLIADHKGYCEADYKEFERQFDKSSRSKDTEAGFGVSLLWNRKRRQQYIAAVKRGWGPWRAHPYERLWSFFASYVLVESGSSQLSLMVDQYYLWRTGRAISTSLVILILEVWYLTVGFPWFSQPPMPHVSWLVAFVPWAVAALAITITLGTYSRLCFTLFSLVYVTQDKRRRN